MQYASPTTLADEMKTTQLPTGAIALWWLGQAGFALRSNALTLYIDPFLSAHPDRQVPAPLTPEVSPPVDFVLCTHEHIDHLDIPTLQALAVHSPEAQFVVPRPIMAQLIAAGIAAERVLGVQPDEQEQGYPLGKSGTRLFPVPALHGLNCPPRDYNFGFAESNGLYRYLGYVIDFAGTRVYHSGDTLIYDGMVERLHALALDVALLPINGRSYFREQLHLVGNMDEREAADLAAASGVKVLIPTHYEMFAANVGRPGFLVDYVRTAHPELACYLPAHGRRFIYMK